MSRVKLDVLKPWITQRITQLLGIEDDVVIEFVFNQLEERVMPKINTEVLIKVLALYPYCFMSSCVIGCIFVVAFVESADF